jgi:hypothetical protein
MKTLNNTTEKLVKLFTEEFGYTPNQVSIINDVLYCDQYSARVVNGKLKKVQGIYFRLA